MKNTDSIKSLQRCAEIKTICGKTVNHYNFPKNNLVLSRNVKDVDTPRPTNSTLYICSIEKHFLFYLYIYSSSDCHSIYTHAYTNIQTGSTQMSTKVKWKNKLWDIQKNGKSLISVNR